MKHDPDRHHRRSVRLRGYNYSVAGAYFVTICVHGRECLFGEIRNCDMKLNNAGRVIEEWWHAVTDHFVNVALDEYVIMPNHFHGIVMITNAGAGFPRPHSGSSRPMFENVDANPVGAGFPRPMLNPPNKYQGGTIPVKLGGTTPVNQGGEVNLGGETPPLRSLGQIVGYFKYQSTKQINQMRDNPGCPVWQRNYHERVIRDERELDAARKYIVENPIKWDRDLENPINAPP